MPNLKSLVDEVVNIENDIVECRDTLKQILIDKKIEGLESENKLSILINKVNEFKDFIPNTYLYENGKVNCSYNLVSSGSNNQGTIKLLSNRIEMNAQNTGGGDSVRGIKLTKIDLTEYTYLVLDFEVKVAANIEYSGFRIEVSDSKGNNVAQYSLDNSNYTRKRTKVINISTLSGVHTIFIYSASDGGNGKYVNSNVYEICLEA